MSNKVTINLENYPNLLKLYETNKSKELQTMLKESFEHLDRACEEERFKTSKRVYKRSYTELTEDVMQAFFRFNEIAQKHTVEAEQEALAELQEDIHPLSIFTNKAPVYNLKGENISPTEWIKQDRFNLTDWLLGLFYASRFVSWHELSEYLTLGQYDLIEVLKARNFEQLADIQPALDFQEQNGIPKGKLVYGTGLFDCVTDQPIENDCLACGSELTKNKISIHCPTCKAGFAR